MQLVHFFGARNSENWRAWNPTAQVQFPIFAFFCMTPSSKQTEDVKWPEAEADLSD
jgi:hypothetical protein